MARMVTSWRGKCGTRLKVEAEADSTSSAAQTVSRPTCHHPHAIRADKITSVTEDLSEGGAAAVFCVEKQRYRMPRRMHLIYTDVSRHKHHCGAWLLIFVRPNSRKFEAA
jgi:hypothetical protein